MAIHQENHGPWAFLEEVLNQRRQWQLGSIETNQGESTSVSDIESYTAVCKAAANDANVFQNFKSEIGYRRILEHIGYSNGIKYAQILQDRGFTISRKFLKRHSNIGNPEKFTIRPYGRLSPSLLRYMKVASDHFELFPGWREKVMVEVGIGYGGQLAVFKELGHTKNYIGVDLPVVASLAEKYLVSAKLTTGYQFDVESERIKLLAGHHFISNYAFSELIPSLQEKYFQWFVRNSASGYVTWNTLSEEMYGGISAKDFAQRVGGRLIAEEPLTSPGNSIVVWGS